MELVTDRYPDLYEPVLIYDLYNGYAIASWDGYRFSSSYGFDKSNYGIFEYRNVAGWMKLDRDIGLHTTIEATVSKYRMKAEVLSKSERFDEDEE